VLVVIDYKTLWCVSGRKILNVFFESDYWNNGPWKCISAEHCRALLLLWPIYKLSISYKQLRHIENSIVLYKKEGTNGLDIAHRRTATLGAPRRHTPMHNIGPLNRYAVMADALLKDTGGRRGQWRARTTTDDVKWYQDFSLPGIFAPRSESSQWEPSLPGT